MIFAEMEYQKHYSDFHAELLAFIGRHFSQVQAGLQGDSWIWILDGEEKRVIETLLRQFEVKVYEEPASEGHEDV
jgi:hypothetical protein